MSCARSLYADLSLSGSLHQNPAGLLALNLWAQDLNLGASASGSCRTTRSLRQDLCNRTLYGLCKISVSGSLVSESCIDCKQQLVEEPLPH